jgi:hypothetical protein
MNYRSPSRIPRVISRAMSRSSRRTSHSPKTPATNTTVEDTRNATNAKSSEIGKKNMLTVLPAEYGSIPSTHINTLAWEQYTAEPTRKHTCNRVEGCFPTTMYTRQRLHTHRKDRLWLSIQTANLPTERIGYPCKQATCPHNVMTR